MGIDKVSVIAARILRDIVDKRVLKKEVDISDINVATLLLVDRYSLLV